MEERVTWAMVEKRAGYIGKLLGADRVTVAKGSAAYRYETVIDFHYDDMAGDREQVTYGHTAREVLDQLAALEDGVWLQRRAVKAGHVAAEVR